MIRFKLKIRLILFFIILSQCTIKTTNIVEFECPTGWTLIDDKCVKYFSHLTTWEYALKSCDSEGANLIEIWGNKQNDKIFDYAKSQNPTVNEYWIGMNRIGLLDKTWIKWSKGTTIKSQDSGYWANKQPDNTANSIKDCVSAKTQQKDFIYPVAYLFNKCSDKKHYICQKKSVCLKNYFSCNEGKCIKNEDLCDQYNDCIDGSDELNCPNKFYKLLSLTTGTITFSVGSTKYNEYKWLISSTPGNRILLKFTQFISQKDIDIVKIYSGAKNTIDSTCIAIYSGVLTADQLSLVSLDNNVIIEFIPSSVTSTFSFTLSYNAVDDQELSKKEILKAKTTLIDLTSPNYPNPSYGLFQKYWDIIGVERSVITLTIKDLHLEKQATVQIIDNNNGNPIILANYHNEQFWKKEISVISITNIVSVVLTNNYNDKAYFKLSYMQGCGFNLKAMKGVISSPGFSLFDYPPNQKCVWTIEPTNYPFSSSLTLKRSLASDNYKIFIDDFLIVNSVDANNKEISIFESKNDIGALNDLVLVSATGKFTVKFNTNAINQASGFQLTFCIDCTDPKIDKFTVMTPNTRKIGDKPVFTCLKGHVFVQDAYKTQNSINSECKSDGWSICPIPNCQPIVCGNPIIDANTILISKTGIVYQSVATYKCTPNSILDTSVTTVLTATCLDTGKWSTSPKCKVVSCPVIVIVNGVATKTFGTLTEVNSIYSVKCNQGYYTSSVNLVKCGIDLKWSPTLPSCLAVSCPTRIYPYSDYVKTNIDLKILKYKESTPVSCLVGFKEKNGKTTVECQISQLLTDFECINIDECATTKPCDVNSVCEDLLGGYKCNCKAGYSQKDQNTCQDIDECLVNNGGCEEKCTNTLGSYTCSCTTTGKIIYSAANLNNIPLGTNEDGTKVGDIPRIQHSCIYKQCTLPTLVAAVDKPFRVVSPVKSKTIIYVGETVYYSCNLGYIITGAAFHKCLNGETIVAPTCAQAKCVIPTAPIKNAPVLTPTFGSSVNFGDKVSKNCAGIQNGATTDLFCIYDSTDNSYKIHYGASLECPVIDCGVPPTVLNGDLVYTLTYVGSSVAVNCKTNFHLAEDVNKNSKSVLCKIDTGGTHAYWDYQSVECVAISCKEPTLPAEATYTFPDLNNKNFGVGTVLTISCSLGYTPNVATMTCTVANNVPAWNPVAILCEDKEKPVFTACSTAVSFESGSSPIISVTVTDNSNHYVITNDYLGFHFTTLPAMIAPLTIIYTATDPSQNKATCTAVLTPYDTAHVYFTCPTSYVIKVNPSGSVPAFDIAKTPVTGAVGFSLVTDSATVSAVDVGKINVFKITGTKGMQKGSCYYSYSVELNQCMSNGLTQIKNADITYTTDVNNDFVANLKCKAGFVFMSTGLDAAVYNCKLADNLWKNGIKVIEDCVAQTPSSKTTKVVHTYATASLLTQICMDGHLAAFKVFEATLLLTLTNICKQTYTVPGGCTATTSNHAIAKINDKEYTITVIFSFLPDSLYAVYIAQMKVFLDKIVAFPANILKTTGCVDATYGSYALTLTETCAANRIKKLIGTYNFCLACPAGTKAVTTNTVVTCPVCAVNTFSAADSLTCTACPTGKITVATGSSSANDCIDTCTSKGWIATNAELYKICKLCLITEKFDAAQNKCVACTVGEQSYDLRTTCTAKCLIGEYSPTGYGPCKSCPKNFYQDLTGQMTCKSCGAAKVTLAEKASAIASCVANTDAGVCPAACAGACSVTKFIATCNTCGNGLELPDCVKDKAVCANHICHYKGTCAIDKTKNPAKPKCTCVPGYTGVNCETKTTNNCAAAPCSNGGSCIDALVGFTCICRDGFTGATCATKFDYCTKVTCSNAGTCVSYGIRSICNCPKGYNGDKCATKIDYCLEKPCGPKGTCASTTNGATCTCIESYTGTFCFTVPKYCGLNTCTTATEMCIDSYKGSKAYCVCPSDYNSAPAVYTSARNGYSITSLNLGKCGVKLYCAQNPCLNGGTCKEGTYTFVCTCATGYKGATCNVNIDNCIPNPCKNKKKCTDLVNDFSCACGTDYSGKDCSKYIAGCASNKCSAIGTDVTLPNKGCNEIESQLLFQCICKVGYYSNLCSVIHNNCNHNPCVNGACTSSLNAYSCSCTAGWSGKNCDEPLNICLTKTCQNSGVCNTIFNDIYCACTTGYSGNVCETKLTYCDANSCLGAGSTCVEAVNKYTCTCVGDYSGSYCEYNKKACAKIVCENNGKLVHDGNKYVCQCQLDFEGTLCEKSKDNCLNVNIVVPAKCIDGIGTYYILCPPGYESSDCKSKANPDFDLKFFSNGQNQGVRSLHPFLMDSSALTFGLWFKLDTISGTLFQLFELTSSFSIVDARKIIDFDVKKITVSIDPASSVSYTFNANLFSIEKWYYVVIAWDNVAGNLEIYVNSAKEYTMNNYALNKKLAKYGTVSLGAAYTPNNHDFTANTKITGSITRVTGWSKQLTHTEISTLSGSPTSTVVPNLMVHWGQYMIGSGVSVIRPSKVTEVVSVCPVGFTGANCKTPLKDKISPIFKSCPSNKIHTTSTGKVQSSWDIPIVEGATTTPQSNYALGASLNPDTYNIVYIAYDASKNAAICSFYYTVQELLCLTPKLNVADKFATQFCSTGYYPVKHCAPKCPKNSAFLVASPNIYTCGTQGSFSYRNTLTVTYPKCEIVKQENLNAKVLIRYDSITACLQLLNTNTIKDHFCKIMNTVNQKWGKTLGGKNALCPNGDCCTSSNVKLVISCHTPSNLDLLLANSVNAIKRRRRQTQSQNSALITLSIDGIPLIVYDSTLSQEAQNLIYHFLLDLGASDLTKLLVNGNPTFITLNTIPSCLEGQTLQNNNCYDCPIGTYFVAGECFNCPINTYQPLTKQTLCLSCPVNQITMNTGSIALTDCIDKCPIGKYHGFNLVNGIQVPVCIDCPKGSYQDLIGQTVCKYCDADKTTQNLGSTTITSCYIICPSGQEYIMTSCKDCPIDRYRTTGVNFNCVSCPANFIATAPGAKIAAECTISACAAGNYRNVATNVCIACPRGQYQPAIWQTSCISCPAGKTTVGTASTALTNCLFYCAPGSYQADLAVETCSPCLVGFFKDNDIPKKECTACISPFVTASTASKLITDCNVLKCPKGNEGKVDKCIPCQIGFYKDNENVNQMCVACPKTHVTISTGSIASTDCNIPICKIGYENIDGICQPCKVGFYKSTVGPLDVCIVCPINYATAVTGATSNTDCNLLKCPKGKQEIFGVCTDCPVAYFKSVDTPKSFCVNCPVSYTTIGVGSKSLLDCKLLICQKGYHEVAQICVPCIIGYYKDNELPTKLCVKCPSSHVTKTTGSTSSNDCNVHICPKGYEEENYQCNPCKIGYYKDITTANVKCSICPITHSTKNIGSDSLSDCNVLRCELGQEDINGVCVACIQGYYKDNTNAGDECKHCPDSYTTVKTGSIYKSDCILHICPKGFENLNDKCTPCKLGYYKDNEDPLEVCKICPATFSTYSIGATKVEDCNLKLCPKGFEEVAQMCTPCKVGFYKNNDLTNTKCVACPITFITENTGSQKVEDCSVHKCDAGYESINDQCSPCSVGYYKNNNYPSQKCYKCPATFVTATMASKYITDCKLQKCEPGYESINNLCSPCPLNKYKDNNNYAEMCSDCPSTYLTHFTASTSINDCNLLQCDEGFEENDGRCSPCKIGYYKDNNLPLKVCAKCPSTFITEKMSSESINDCNLLICQKGYEEIKGTCVACEIGSYKENEIPESRCIKCPPTFMTKFTGSILASDCNIQKCPAGQYSKYSKCIYCQIGYFRTVDGSLYECTKCPNEYSTVKMGSQSIFDCSEHICPLGQESIQGICQSCKIGYYKGTNSKEDCKPCPIGIFTKRIGSTSDSDCNVKNCPEGYENINLQCYPCKVGFYKDSDDHSLCKKCYNERLTINSASTSISNCTVESCGAGKYYNMDRKLCTICDIGEYRESDGDALKCEKCNNDLITEYEGSVSYNDCNIVKCEPGTRRINDDLCEKCQIGYYQTKKWQTKCEKCPVNYTTLKIGQDSESDCIYDCDTGYEKSDNEDKCVECERGYYRNKFQNVKCIKCPIAFTTPDIGSGSPLDCNIANCGIGEYVTSLNECKKCPLGTFLTLKDRYSHACTPCPHTFTTSREGSTSQLDCFSNTCKNKKHNCGSFEDGNICVDISNGFKCECRRGWIKTDWTCRHQCDNDFCKNGGICDRQNIENPRCICRAPYTGANCNSIDTTTSNNEYDSYTRTIIIIASTIGGVIVLGIVIILVAKFLTSGIKSASKPVNYINHGFDGNNPYPSTHKVGSMAGTNRFAQRLPNQSVEFYDIP